MESKKNNNQHVPLEGELSLKEFISKAFILFLYLRQRWLSIFFAMLIGAIIGLSYAFTKKPIFTAITTFVLEDEKAGGGNLGSLAGIASIAGIDLGSGGGGIFQGDNILELYRSRTIIEKTLLSPINVNGRSTVLVDYFIEFNKLRDAWKNNPVLKNISFEGKNLQAAKFPRVKDSVLNNIIKDISNNYLKVSKPDKKLGVIYAEVRSENELFAKAFNEQVVKNVSDFYIQTKTKKSLANVSILQQKVDSVRSELFGAIYTSATVVDATPNLNPTRQIQRVAPVQKSQFLAETNKLILGELIKNLEISKIALRKETPLIQIIDGPIFPLQVEKVGKLKCLLLGSFIGGFLIIFFLTMKLLLKNILD
ncbi:MAG: lipopolysaccharide biosynthesis protein [Pedobacter sp.]